MDRLENMEYPADISYLPYGYFFGRDEKDEKKARSDEVKKKFGKIKKRIQKRTITFQCNGRFCEPTWGAYVLSDYSLKIFICSNFWDYPAIGYGSKGTTIIHELSHEGIGGTEDYAYGVFDSKILALTFPEKAIENADSYAHFAYDTYKKTRNRFIDDIGFGR